MWPLGQVDLEPLQILRRSVLFGVGAELPGRAMADHSRVVQILTNLISNAIKSTPKDGEITVFTPVGGIAELPDVAAAPQQALESQGGTDFVIVSAAAGLAAAGLLLRRRLR